MPPLIKGYPYVSFHFQYLNTEDIVICSLRLSLQSNTCKMVIIAQRKNNNKYERIYKLSLFELSYSETKLFCYLK